MCEKSEAKITFFLSGGGKKLFGKKRFCPALVSRAWKRHQRSSALPFHYGKSWRHFAVWSLDVLRQESTRRASMVQKSYHSCLSMHVKLLSNSPRHPPKGYQAHWYSPFWDPENLTKGSGFKPNCVCTARWNNSCRPSAKSAKEINQSNQWPPFFHVFSLYPPGIMGNYL
jgi:hypothetical protein